MASHPPTSPGDTTYYCEDAYGAVTRELTGHPLFKFDNQWVIETRDTRNTYNRQRQLIQSAFTFDTLELLRTAAFFRAAFNVLGQITLGLAALWLGYLLAKLV